MTKDGLTVLQLTRLNGAVFALNPDLIERAEATPDTVLTLVNGGKYVIHESLDELIALILDYRAQVIAAAQIVGSPRPAYSSPSLQRDGVRAVAAHRETLARGTVIALHPQGE